MRSGAWATSATAISAIWSATSSTDCEPPEWNHHATQLHIPMSASAVVRTGRGRNSPLRTPWSTTRTDAVEHPALGDLVGVREVVGGSSDSDLMTSRNRAAWSAWRAAMQLDERAELRGGVEVALRDLLVPRRRAPR